MTDLFTQHAATAIPRVVQRKQERVESALDRKMAEKQRLAKKYRQAVRAEQLATLAKPEAGPMKAFRKWVRSIRPGSADVFIETLKQQAWLTAAPADIRHLALQWIDRHCDRLTVSMGGEKLDDPIFGEPETVYFRAKAVLGVK